jgi:hypothetical protein
VTLQLDFDLAEPGDISPRRRPQSFIGREDETLAPRWVFAHDGLTVLVYPDYP